MDTLGDIGDYYRGRFNAKSRAMTHVLIHNVVLPIIDRLMLRSGNRFPHCAKMALVELTDSERIKKYYRKCHSKLELRAKYSRCPKRREQALKGRQDLVEELRQLYILVCHKQEYMAKQRLQ